MLQILLFVALLHHSFGAEYDVNAPITLTNDTLFTGNGTGAFFFNGGITGSNVTLTKSGTSYLRLNGTSSIGSINMTAGGLAVGITSSTSNATGALTVTNTFLMNTAGAGPSSGRWSFAAPASHARSTS